MWLHILAFCGFYVGGAGQKMYNNATEVVLMRHGTTTVLSMENNYQGPPSDFAMVVPVPVVVRESQVKTLDRGVFEKIDTLGAPRLVEYWEHDPCKPYYDEDNVKYELAEATLPIPVRQPQGCGCEAQGGAQGLAGFALLGLWLRRKRR